MASSQDWSAQPVASSPKEFAAFLRSEREQWAKVAKAANINPKK